MSWDDGKHTKVNRVQLTFDDVIRSIEVEYEGTNLQSQRRGTVGTKSEGFTLGIDEYITEVSGYYKTTFSGDVITALTFKTNKKTYGLYGNKTQSYFSADAPSGNQIAGFLGTSGNALSSIDVHFAPIPAPGSIKPKPVNPGTDSGSGGGGGSKPVDPGTDSGKGGGGSKPGDSGADSGKDGSKPDGPGKMGPLGGDKGNEFKDVGFEGVKKITVGADQYSVTYIKIEYVKEGNVVVREHGTIRGELQEFSVDYPKDNIVAVGGTYNHIYTYDTTLITSLYFTTSKGFTSPLFGQTKGTDFNFKGENGGKLVGFHGRGGNAIDAIGAYFDTGSKTAGPGGKTGPLGGDKGKEFNDVGFEGVKKITVGADEYSVTYIEIEYVKEGKVEILEHGTSRGELKEFSVDYPKDNIVAVGGTYNHIFNYDTTLITSLYFTTSKGFTSPLFGKSKGTDFKLKGDNGGKLIGFHGRGGFAIDALGAYFDTGSQGGDGGKDGSKPVVPGTDSGSGSKPDGSGKKGPLGGDKGKEFSDDGFEGLKKITVGADEYSVSYIKIEYVKDGNVVVREHGTSRGELKEFSVDYPKEHITAVGGSYNHIYNYDTTLITSLYFTTSKGFTSPLFGKTKGTDFNLKGEDGGKLLGFHGRGGFAIDAIGAYFETSLQGGDGDKDGSNPDVPGKKGPLGGDKGEEFNDVGFQGMKKVTVGADNLSITYIKIEYVKDGKVEIREHGTARGELKEFSVDYPKDSITAVGGSFKHNYTYDTTLITSLYFTTSKGFTSPLFGEKKEKGTDFEFKGENGGKLLGFHGRGGNAIDAIGAYFDTSSQGGDGGGSGAGSNNTQKLDAQGGKGGNQWDDGGDHDGVTKINVAVARGVIEEIRFEYVKNGQTKEGAAHGVKGARALITTIEISHPNEYLLSVKGWSNASNNVVGVQFITNTKTSEYCGFEKSSTDEGTDISLEVKDKKIVGFHGFADTHLNSLGAYFAPK